MKDNNKMGKRNVWAFFGITVVISWLLWLPFVLAGAGVIALTDTLAALTTPAVMLGAFAPLISAVIMIVRKEGWAGLKQFFRKALSFRIKPIYYVLAVLIPLLITALAHYTINIAGIDILPSSLFPADFPVPVAVLIIPYFLFIAIAGGGQEEFGWRGYALQPLQQRFGILRASIIIGIVWGVWHLPLWFMPGEGHAYYSFFAFLLFTVSMSVIIGWLYNASGKKMVVAWIFHSISNVSVPLFPIMHMADVPQPGYWVWVGVNVIGAVLFTVWYTRKAKIAAIAVRPQEV